MNKHSILFEEKVGLGPRPDRMISICVDMINGWLRSGNRLASRAGRSLSKRLLSCHDACHYDEAWEG